MFKKIPGTVEYRIDLNGQIVDSTGTTVDFKTAKLDKIKICLFNKNLIVSKLKLKLLAWYESSHIPSIDRILDNIRFQKVESKVLRLQCGYIQYFKEPVEYKPGYRIIPSYPRYAISLDGAVIDTVNNSIVDKTMIDTDGYLTVYIYNPDRCSNRWTRVHRLKCLAWLPNSDYNLRPYVNHIDGDKLNNALENLEWVSNQENSQHAVQTGLNDCSIKMKVRDAFTGQIEIYNSIAELARKLGVSGGLSKYTHLYKLPGHLYRGRYEIKPLNDETDWFYENREVKEHNTKKPHFVITVIDKKTGKLSTYLNIKELKKIFKIRPISDNIDVIISLLKEKHPHLNVSYERKALRGPYYAKNLTTGKLVIASSLKEMGGQIGVGYNELQIDLTRGRKFIYDNQWIVTVNPNQANYDEYVVKKDRFAKVETVNKQTGEITVFKSGKIAAEFYGVDPKSVYKYMDSGKAFKGIEYRAVT